MNSRGSVTGILFAACLVVHVGAAMALQAIVQAMFPPIHLPLWLAGGISSLTFFLTFLACVAFPSRQSQASDPSFQETFND
jgi:hypothetical protein